MEYYIVRDLGSTSKATESFKDSSHNTKCRTSHLDGVDKCRNDERSCKYEVSDGMLYPTGSSMVVS